MKEREVKQHLKDQIRSGRLPFQGFHIEKISDVTDKTPKDLDRTRRKRARKGR